jgi:alpha-tubulin suppressor-like RCC1 family protein
MPPDTQLGLGDTRSRPKPAILPPGPALGAQMVACGHYHTLVITPEGSVLTWGVCCAFGTC